MADKPSTQDTIKNLLGDIADSSNKAFNDFLDPPNKSRKSDYPDWFGAANPMAALAGTPLGALQAMAAFGGGGLNPVAALAGANPLALLAGASSDRNSGQVNPWPPLRTPIPSPPSRTPTPSPSWRARTRRPPSPDWPASPPPPTTIRSPPSANSPVRPRDCPPPWAVSAASPNPW